jgi:hypothetical protein
MEKPYKFLAKDFYEMLEKQNYKCPLTGRELTPETTTAEHIVQLQAGGIHRKENIYLIHRDVARIKRFMSENDVINLAFDILKTMGKAYGFTAKKILQD